MIHQRLLWARGLAQGWRFGRAAAADWRRVARNLGRGRKPPQHTLRQLLPHQSRTPSPEAAIRTPISSRSLRPAVVTIHVEGKASASPTDFQMPDDDFLRRFFGGQGAPGQRQQQPRTFKQRALGSGCDRHDGRIHPHQLSRRQRRDNIQVEMSTAARWTAKLVGSGQGQRSGRAQGRRIRSSSRWRSAILKPSRWATSSWRSATRSA